MHKSVAEPLLKVPVHGAQVPPLPGQIHGNAHLSWRLLPLLLILQNKSASLTCHLIYIWYLRSRNLLEAFGE